MREQSYSLGVLLGNNLVGQVDVSGLDYDALGKGLMDILKGNDLEMTEQEANQTAQMFLQESAAKMAMKAQEMESTFLAENGERDGVIVRPSGLQYEILEEGNGCLLYTSPSPRDRG